MLKTFIVSALLITSPSAVYAADAKPATTPIAVVNGKEIPAIYGDLMKREMIAQGQPDNAQLQTRIRESLINMEILSRAAIEKGLDKDPSLSAALDIQRKNTFAKAYLEDYVKTHPISDAEIQAEYDRAKTAASPNEYRVRHILVKTEDEAKKVLSELNKNGKFADLAKKYSLDPGSAKNGGDLNWADPNAFVKEFSDALVSLKKGEVTKTPVKTQFGYHKLKLEDVRPSKIPALADVKGEVQKQLQQKRVRDAITAARTSAKVE
ncbi:MAG: peptidylprolyl isomerase [Thiobacillus sp.]